VGWSADWETLRSRPTIARILETVNRSRSLRQGICKRTVQRWLRWLETRGLLEVLTEGSTPQFRAGILHGEGGNDAREWRLVDPTVTPSRNLFSWTERTPVRVRTQPKKLSDEGRRRESARFLRAGWQIADIHFATSHTPDGTPWAFSDQPRWPRAHLRWRLSWWLGPGGCPLPSPSQLRAARFVARAIEQDRRRAERKTGTPPPQAWHEARAELERRVRFPQANPPRKA
jgi:hypothetical protein